jgi:hypothetical protein
MASKGEWMHFVVRAKMTNKAVFQFTFTDNKNSFGSPGTRTENTDVRGLKTVTSSDNKVIAKHVCMTPCLRI